MAYKADLEAIANLCNTAVAQVIEILTTRDDTKSALNILYPLLERIQFVVPDVKAPAALFLHTSGIKAKRLQLGINQTQAARMCGTNQSQYSRIEMRKSQPTTTQVIRLAAAFGCTMEELLKPV